MQILYIDMDGTLVDFKAGIDTVTPEQKAHYGEEYDEIPGFFDELPPMPGAVEAFHRLAEKYDTYILSTAPWGNHTAWSAKNLWVKKHLPEAGHKRLILSHHKNLVQGDYLIDDRDVHGVRLFGGEHIHFGTKSFPDWDAVLEYLL